MSDRKTRDQHRRKFQELIDPENRSKRFRGEGNNKDDITPSSGIGITPAVAEAKLPLAAEAEVEVEVKGTTTLPSAEEAKATMTSLPPPAVMKTLPYQRYQEQ